MKKLIGKTIISDLAALLKRKFNKIIVCLMLVFMVVFAVNPVVKEVLWESSQSGSIPNTMSVSSTIYFREYAAYYIAEFNPVLEILKILLLIVIAKKLVREKYQR